MITVDFLLIKGEEEKSGPLYLNGKRISTEPPSDDAWNQLVGGITQTPWDDPELSRIAQEIVENALGTGDYKDGWKQGDDEIEYWPDRSLPIKWTTIECSNCGAQVYFDKVMKRHRCGECSYGF